VFDFFQRLQSAPPLWVAPGAIDAAVEYGKYSSQSIIRQYMGDAANKSRGPLRLSSLGKPAVEIATKLPGPKDELASWGFHNHPFDETMRLVFSMGDWFENWVGFQLRRLGYTIHQCDPCSDDGQHKAEFEGVPGHLDFVVSDPKGYKFVLEVKTMSSHYFNQFFDVRYNEQDMFLTRVGAGDDERGYLTQLATYMHHTGLPGYWLALDKGSRKMALGQPDPAEVSGALHRARRIIPIIQNINTLEDVFATLAPPPGEPEVYKKQFTGLLKVPTAMAYFPYRDVFYQTQKGKNGYGKANNYVGEFDVEEYLALLATTPEEPERMRFLMRHTERRTYQEAVELFTSAPE